MIFCTIRTYTTSFLLRYILRISSIPTWFGFILERRKHWSIRGGKCIFYAKVECLPMLILANKTDQTGTIIIKIISFPFFPQPFWFWLVLRATSESRAECISCTKNVSIRFSLRCLPVELLVRIMQSSFPIDPFNILEPRNPLEDVQLPHKVFFQGSEFVRCSVRVFFSSFCELNGKPKYTIINSKFCISDPQSPKGSWSKGYIGEFWQPSTLH